MFFIYMYINSIISIYNALFPEGSKRVQLLANQQRDSGGVLGAQISTLKNHPFSVFRTRMLSDHFTGISPCSFTRSAVGSLTCIGCDSPIHGTDGLKSPPKDWDDRVPLIHDSI